MSHNPDLHDQLAALIDAGRARGDEPDVIRSEALGRAEALLSASTGARSAREHRDVLAAVDAAVSDIMSRRPVGV